MVNERRLVQCTPLASGFLQYVRFLTQGLYVYSTQYSREATLSLLHKKAIGTRYTISTDSCKSITETRVFINMRISIRDAIKYTKKGASSIQPGPPSLPGSAESLQQTTPALRLERLSGRRKSFNLEQRTYKEQSTRSYSSFNEDAKNRLCIANVSKHIPGGMSPAKVLHTWR